MPRSVSHLFSSFLPSFCRIRSIRFALLNYLIRTHPSRWASRSLINSIPAFSHPGAVRLCRLRFSIFPSFCRSLSASVLQGCLLDFHLFFFFYYSRRGRSWELRNLSSRFLRFRFWKVHGRAVPYNFRISLRPRPLKHTIPMEISRVHCRAVANFAR